MCKSGGGFRLSLKRRLVLTPTWVAGLLFFTAHLFEMCFTGGPAAGSKPWAHAASQTHISAAESECHILWAAGSQFGGEVLSSFAFPGLLGHHNQKPARSIMGDRQGDLLGSGLLVGLSMWALGWPRSMKVWLALLPSKQASEISLFEGVIKVLDIFYPLAEGEMALQRLNK